MLQRSFEVNQGHLLAIDMAAHYALRQVIGRSYKIGIKIKILRNAIENI